MKKICIVFCLFINILHANKDYELFLQGNQLVQQGNYQSSLQAYDSIKIQSSFIFYNRGLIEYALGNYVHALGALRCAELRASSDLLKKIERSLVVVQNKLGLPQDNWIYRLLVSLQSGIWLGCNQVGLLLLFIFLSIILYRRKNINTKYLLLQYGIILFGIVIISIKIFAYYYIHQPYAIIVAKDASVFVGPNKEFEIVGHIFEGQSVELVDENPAWCKMHSRDTKGWVQKDDVLIIEDHK